LTCVRNLFPLTEFGVEILVRDIVPWNYAVSSGIISQIYTRIITVKADTTYITAVILSFVFTLKGEHKLQ
jgi:hypothetical protein